MKLFRLIAVAIGLGLFMAVPQLTTAARATDDYTAYIACGYRTDKPPATTCPKKGRIGAFFVSNNADVMFKTCVTFPNGQYLCSKKGDATEGQSYVNHVTAGSKGKLKVQWKVAGSVVATYTIKVT